MTTAADAGRDRDGESRSGIVVSLVTQESVLVGTLRLPSLEVAGSTYHFRMLELLNNPRLSGLHGGQYRDSILVEEAFLLPERGPRLPVAPELYVRPHQIVCAYEFAEDGRADPVRFSPQRFRRPEGVVVATTTGLLIDGVFLGGVASLATTAQKPFLPIVEARIASTDAPKSKLCVPFAIVNDHFVAAFSRREGLPVQQ